VGVFDLELGGRTKKEADPVHRVPEALKTLSAEETRLKSASCCRNLLDGSSGGP